MKPALRFAIILIVEIIAVKIIAMFPSAVDDFYTNSSYRAFAKLLRYIFGWIPFSVGDIAYILIGIYLIYYLIRLFKNWKLRKQYVVPQILRTLCYFYFIFNLFWGLNYYKTPLNETLHIGKEYSDEQLMVFTEQLINKTNEIHRLIVDKDSMKVVFPYNQNYVFDANVKSYATLSRKFPTVNYQIQSTKISLLSTPLSYMGFSGYLNPFTNEAQVNGLMPMVSFPTTAAHEMAHQIGFASESEANFIGFQASINNSDNYFKYSGYSVALRYCMSNWAARNPDVFEMLKPKIHYGIRLNYKESSEFWDQYQSFVEVGFKMFYDRFLKLNQQKDGLDSYSRFVDLLVNYYAVNKL